MRIVTLAILVGAVHGENTIKAAAEYAPCMSNTRCRRHTLSHRARPHGISPTTRCSDHILCRAVSTTAYSSSRQRSSEPVQTLWLRRALQVLLANRKGFPGTSACTGCLDRALFRAVSTMPGRYTPSQQQSSSSSAPVCGVYGDQQRLS